MFVWKYLKMNINFLYLIFVLKKILCFIVDLKA